MFKSYIYVNSTDVFLIFEIAPCRLKIIIPIVQVIYIAGFNYYCRALCQIAIKLLGKLELAVKV